MLSQTAAFYNIPLSLTSDYYVSLITAFTHTNYPIDTHWEYWCYHVISAMTWKMKVNVLFFVVVFKFGCLSFFIFFKLILFPGKTRNVTTSHLASMEYLLSVLHVQNHLTRPHFMWIKYMLWLRIAGVRGMKAFSKGLKAKVKALW